MSPFCNFFYKLAAFIIRLIFHVNGGLTVAGTEKIPEKGGVIIAANHISYLDPPLIGAVIPRKATFMARRGLFDVPVLGWIIKSAAFPVHRGKTRPSTIKEAINRLKNNELIVMFPEGRRSETGNLLEAKRGIGMIASLSKVPVIPALISGTDRALPVDAKWIRRSKITVMFGNPIYFPENDGNSFRQHHQHEEISNKIMNAIKDLRRNFTGTI